MPGTEILRIRNYIRIIATFSFRVNVQICWSESFRTKTGKTGLHNYILDLDTVKKARNELDGACDLYLFI